MAGASLLSRVLTDPMLTGISFVDAHGALRAGQLVEVCGVGGSGKTEILMQAAVNCVMPKRRGGVDFGGCTSSVLLVDLDGKFDTLRLLKILTTRIKDAIANAAAPQASPAELEALNDQVYVECMSRFQMLRCHSSLDFLKALSVVERIFTVQEEKFAATNVVGEGGRSSGSRDKANDDGGQVPRPKRLLLIDNVAAFYWLDRASRREQGAPLSLHAVHHASAAKLQDLSRR